MINARDEKGREIPQLFLNGNVVALIFVTEKPFDLKGLAERLEKVFPRMVKLYDDIGVIVVMDRIRLNEDGILEGSGPAAERVKRVYDEFKVAWKLHFFFLWLIPLFSHSRQKKCAAGLDAKLSSQTRFCFDSVMLSRLFNRASMAL